MSARLPRAVHQESARCITVDVAPVTPLAGQVAVVCAGTSDLPVAEEAAITAELPGRLRGAGSTTSASPASTGCSGARMTSAKPTSSSWWRGWRVPCPRSSPASWPPPWWPSRPRVGYGASFEGLAALLAMLNSCAAGLAVVNIDNGFGAGHLACTILRSAARLTREKSR